MKHLRHGAVALLFRIFSILFRLLPLPVARCAGALVGEAAGRILPSTGRRIRKALRCAFPGWSEDKLRACRLHNMRHYGITLAEMFHMERIFAEMEVSGLKRIPDGGFVFISGHIGLWELIGWTFGRRTGGASVIAREAYLPIINRFLGRLREQGNAETILRGTQGSPRRLLHAIRGGRSIGLLIDQDTRVEGVFVDFFGRPAHTPVGAARIAVKYQKPVVCAFTHRGLDGRHRILLQEPIDPRGWDEKDLTGELTKRIEEQIRRHPTQWVWLHRRWRKKPEEEMGRAS